jgi:hypothetical protein
MKNYLIYYLLITLSIIVNSCTEGFKEEYSKLFIALTEVTAITTPTTDTTPDYTFSSTESGALTYGGSCSSSTTIATTGNNTITLNTLSVGTYADCTITVSKTIANENSEKKLSGSLTITSFTVSSSDNTTTLSAPDNLSASGANNTITLTWNSVSGATSYTLYWDNVSGIDNSDTPITSITNDNYTHSSLDNGSIYYYKVAAVNSSGTGTLSSVASAILDQNIQVSKTFNGHTYALTSDLMNWDEASVNANTFGGYLTTINTKSENTFLTDEFWTSAAKPWHGADEQASEGTWLWDNGTTSGDNGLTDNLCGTKSNCLKSDATWLDGSRKWCTNNPNNSRNTNSESPAYLEYQNCGYIWNNDPNNKYGCWDDTQCSYDKKSIIEFDL